MRHALDIVGGTVAPVTTTRTSTKTAPGATGAVAAAGVRPRPATPSPMAAAPPATRRRRRRGSWLWLVLVFLVAAAAGVGAYLVVRNQADTGGNGSNTGTSSSAPPANQATATVTDFDPFGDQTESSATVGNVVDGDLTTAWQTEGYDNFAEKKGVGLRFDLNGTYSLTSVKVVATEAGWSGAIYVSNASASTLATLAEWGDPVATGSDLGAAHTFSVSPQSVRSVLVWFTALPPAATPGARQSLTVDEVELA